jgi:predicted amidohydrolase
MARVLTIGAAQQGPVSRDESRADVVERLIALMRQGHAMGCDLIVFTEVALVPFFPHWHMSDEGEIDGWFEREMPGPDTQPLFDEARRLGVGFHLGYAELAAEEGEIRRYNAAVLVGSDGVIIGHYRKIHLPGYDRFQRGQPFQNLEKLYFRVGNLGFRTWRAFDGVVGMMICNDRRWPESYRVLALQGAELILMGYNTPVHNPANPGADHLAPRKGSSRSAARASLRLRVRSSPKRRVLPTNSSLLAVISIWHGSIVKAHSISPGIAASSTTDSSRNAQASSSPGERGG